MAKEFISDITTTVNILLMMGIPCLILITLLSSGFLPSGEEKVEIESNSMEHPVDKLSSFEKENQNLLLRYGKSIQNHEREIGELKLLLDQWQSRVIPMLHNEEGKLLATKPKSVERFFALYEAFEPAEIESILTSHREVLAGYKKRLSETRADENYLYDPNGALREIGRMKSEYLSVFLRLKRSISEIDELERGLTPSSMTLKEAYEQLKKENALQLNQAVAKEQRQEHENEIEVASGPGRFLVKGVELTGSIEDKLAKAQWQIEVEIVGRTGSQFEARLKFPKHPYGEGPAELLQRGTISGQELLLTTVRVIKGQGVAAGAKWKGKLDDGTISGRWNWRNKERFTYGDFVLKVRE